MDPLICILPELHEMLLQHFTATDFQETTEVSPHWNETLGKSRKMMEKVKVKLARPFSAIYRLLEAVENVHDGTNRRYQNACIVSWASNSKFSYKFLKYFLSTGQTLLKLEIEMLVELSAENEKFFDELDLSNLKSLKLKFVTEGWTSKFLDRCSSLTELYLCSFYQSDPSKIISIPTLRSFLERNKSLKSLQLCCQYHNAFFNEDISGIARFQLKHYKLLHGGRSELITEVVDGNFMKFLDKQSMSLERLCMDSCNPNLAEHIFNNMPALKYLKILNYFRTEDLRLNLNENIFELSILGTSEDIERIIPFVPNVTNLLINYLTRRNIEIIGRHLPFIQELLFIRRDEVVIDGQEWASLWHNAAPVCRYACMYSE